MPRLRLTPDGALQPIGAPRRDTRARHLDAVQRFRNTAAWRRARDAYRAHCYRDGEPTCWLCNQPIEWSDFTTDHAVPVARGGPPLDPNNFRPAHQRCNSARGAGGAT